MYSKLIKKCVLFAGLSDEETEYSLSFFEAKQKLYKKGDFLNSVSSPLLNFGLVLDGTVQVCMDDIDGHHMIMANVNSGETFGESLCYLGQDAPVYICAVTDAAVLWMNTDRIKAPPGLSGLDIRLANRFTAMLAERTLAMNDRIQILSKSSIRAKLITFFSQYVQRYGSSFTVPFDRSNMATYLGTERSSLSRELSRMKEEGLIEYQKNSFRILIKIYQ